MHALLSMFPLRLGLAMLQGWLQGLDQWGGLFPDWMLQIWSRDHACPRDENWLGMRTRAPALGFQSIDVGFSG